MAEPLWLKKVAAQDLAEYKQEFARLGQYITRSQHKPDTKLDAALLRGEERFPSADDVVRAFRVLMVALSATRAAEDEVSEAFLVEAMARWLRKNLALTGSDRTRLLELVQATTDVKRQCSLLGAAVGAIKRVVGGNGLAKDEQKILRSLAQQLANARLPKATSNKLQQEIELLCNDSTTSRLHPDEGWGDFLRDWMTGLNEDERDGWEAFFREVAAVKPEPPASQWRVELDETGIDAMADLHAAIAAQHRMQLARVPEKSWTDRMHGLINSFGQKTVAANLKVWLSKVSGSKPGMLVRQSLNRELLRGLMWICPQLADEELAQAFPRVAEFLYKINSPLGEAATVVLFHHPGRLGAGPLTVLQGRVRHESRIAFINTALELLAEREGVGIEDLDDGGMPTFGFSEFGKLERNFGGAIALFVVTSGRQVELQWTKPNGEPLKSVPAKVKREQGDEVDGLKALVKTVRDALAGLTEQLERTWLDQRTWDVGKWQTQLIDHPVAGVVGRRLIWKFEKAAQPVIWSSQGWRTVGGTLTELPSSGNVSLWHPLLVDANEVLAWRDYLESQQITQPFKQAYREIYLLTDAEQVTQVYSNRFAAHILRQRQFRVLAKTRGWKTGLLGPWDGGDNQQATRDLRRWNLQAEFWLNGAGDQVETGYQYIATDQVRFHRTGEREPLPLADVPPLVFSELLRDVDLFVGVTSVGNDPNWSDRGTEHRFHDYWHDYSFGPLSTSAETRKTALERIIPRLKISACCHFEDRFLVVRGKLRTYKIHLGSGNCLMLPNDQYLCIVPDRKTPDTQGSVFLPFEGDATLSIILSKALLLADDTNIKDPTITRQIKGQ